jgi:arylsulfatase A-like enzyme
MSEAGISHEVADAGKVVNSQARMVHPRLWSRVVSTAVAVGVLTGLAEVCWIYRINDIDPQWRAVLPSTVAGLGAFTAVALATDTVLLLLVGLVWGGMLAVWRDVRSMRAPPTDRRFAVPWLVITAAMSFLWVGWIGLYIFPATMRGARTYQLTMAAGVAGAMLIAALVVWALNRLRRVHPRLPAACWLVAALGWVAFTLPAYSRQGAAPPDAMEIPIGGEGPRPHILLITLDTLRYDYVACNEVNRWVQTPHLDALAADGLRFEQAISQAPTTTPSHCSIMTSVYPTEHDSMNGKPMRRDLITLAEGLRENGYDTIAFTSATTTRSINSGLDKGFERYVDSLVSWSEVFSRDEFQNLLAFYMLGIAQNSQIRGDVVTRRALAWLDGRFNAGEARGRTEAPFFCWLHYFDPHSPYDPPPPYDELYTDRLAPEVPMRADRERYAGEVTYTDAQVGRIVTELKKRGIYDDTLIIVTSDHGEAFGETHWGQRIRGHGDHLYDSTQRVPLIIKPSREARAARGRRVRTQVELIDLAPTILEYLDVPPPRSFMGRSLVALLTGEPLIGDERPAHAMTWVQVDSTSEPGTPSAYVGKLAHRTPQWKYVVIDGYDWEELYDLARDPEERTNVARSKQELCAERRDAVKAAMPMDRDAYVDPRARLAPALRKQLEALGYLGGRDDQSKTDDDER